jgi:hypothetical protein
MAYYNRLTINPTDHPKRGSTQAASMNGSSRDADAPPPTEQMTVFIKGVKEKAAHLIELIEQITTGRFVGSNLAKNLQEQAEELSAALDVLWGHIADALSGSGSDSQDFADSGISAGPEFGLNQILDVEQRIADASAHSELAIFSLARIRENAMKALRGQGNIEPERALFLLQNDVI